MILENRGIVIDNTFIKNHITINKTYSLDSYNLLHHIYYYYYLIQNIKIFEYHNNIDEMSLNITFKQGKAIRENEYIDCLNHYTVFNR